MKNLTTVVAFMLVLVFGLTPAFAGPSAISSTEGPQAEAGAARYVLEIAAAEALQRARMTKGSRESRCLMKNVELNTLIERLENGEPVMVGEIVDAVDGLLHEFGDNSVSRSDCV